jgi:hypothetical protein
LFPEETLQKPRSPIPRPDTWFPDRASRVYLIFSLLIAVFLWVWTASEAKVINELEVPVDFTGVPEGMVVVGPDAHRSLITQVRGPREIVKRVRQADVEIRVDLSKSGMGPQILEVARQSVRLPSTVEFVTVQPPTLRISLEKLVTATLPVRPSFTGRPAGNLVVAGWSVEPSEVQVSGPSSNVRKINHVETQTVSLDKRREGFTEVVAPVSPDSEVTVVPGPGLTLKVLLGEKPSRRTVEGILVAVVNAGGRSAADPPTVLVSVEGPPSLVGSLGPDDFRCEADAQGLVPADAPYQIKPAVRLARKDHAARVEVTAVSPHFVSVKVVSRR